MMRKDGTVFPIEFALGEVEVGNRRLLTGVMRDISERKKIERTKDEFISSVSHELRTPLTSIRGALALLMSGRKDPLPKRAAALVDIAHKNCERLEALVNDILDLEKLENGTLQFDRRPVGLVPLLRQTIEINAPYMAGYGKSVRLWPVESEMVVLGDEGRLAQVLNNLMSNAARYSYESSVIDVFVARVGDCVRVAVADCGPGIDAEFRKRIFSRFGQADSSDTRKIGGAGLGLAISKAIIERHQGTIGYRTRPQVGMVFFFDLPLHEPETAASVGLAEKRVAVGPSGHPRLQHLADALETAGWTPVRFGSAADAALRMASGALRKMSVPHCTSPGSMRLLIAEAERSGCYPMIWLDAKAAGEGA